MDETSFSVIMGFAGVFGAALLGFLGNKKGTLASAEKDFRETIIRDNDALRERIKVLEAEVRLLREENLAFRNSRNGTGQF